MDKIKGNILTMIVPIMHCFDNNYARAAGVAFYSLLKNSNPKCFYSLYVLHSDISEENQAKLIATVDVFKNASLSFINMEDKFSELWKGLNGKGHYSKEMFYKFLAPSMFLQYDKIMIADVDVVYLSDISEIFQNFDVKSKSYFIGHRGIIKEDSWVANCCTTDYRQSFSEQEITALSQTNACYWIFNLKKMRADNLEQRFIDYAMENLHRIRQPEQDVVNLLCYPHIDYLPANAVVCTYVYELYECDEDYQQDMHYSAEDIKFAMGNPVQLHYAGGEKPWNNPACTKADIWFKYLAETVFWQEWLVATGIQLQELKKVKKNTNITIKHLVVKTLKKIYRKIFS